MTIRYPERNCRRRRGARNAGLRASCRARRNHAEGAARLRRHRARHRIRRPLAADLPARALDCAGACVRTARGHGGAAGRSTIGANDGAPGCRRHRRQAPSRLRRHQCRVPAGRSSAGGLVAANRAAVESSRRRPPSTSRWRRGCQRSRLLRSSCRRDARPPHRWIRDQPSHRAIHDRQHRGILAGRRQHADARSYSAVSSGSPCASGVRTARRAAGAGRSAAAAARGSFRAARCTTSGSATSTAR